MTGKLNERISELQEQLRQGRISRRDFLRYASLLGLSIGTAEALAACAPKAPQPTTAVPPKPTTAPPTAPTTAPPPPEAPAKEALEGHMLMFDPIACTGCLKCATACADKWATEYFPDVAKNT
jgi:ferredoxin